MAPITIDPERIARLAEQASRNPSVYYWKLVILAVAGDVALTACQIAPFMLPVIVGLIIYNPYDLPYWLVILLTTGFFAWMVRPTFRPHGRELTREEAPRLFAEIETIGAKLQAPGKMHVMLDDSFNASAAETRGLFGLVGTECALTLGVPLLAALSREEVIGVIGHEFGHFSRRHGRFGHWLYRARVGWLVYAEDVTESASAYDKAMSLFAERFVPYFSTFSFVHSRQCEYEADSDAATVAGSKTLARALTRLEVGARIWESGFPRKLKRHQRESAQPPADYFERFSAAAAAWPQDEVQGWLEGALRTPSGWKDTHPSLTERLSALREKAELPDTGACAGSELFGDRWPAILAQFNAEWLKKSSTDWLIGHLLYKHIQQPLVDADKTSVAGWPADRQLDRARALRAVAPPEGLAELRLLRDRNPRNPLIAFAYGAALLADNDRTGMDILSGLAREHPLLRVPAYSRLAVFHERQREDDKAGTAAAYAKRAHERRAAARATFREQAVRGRFRDSSLTAVTKAVLVEAIGRDPRVARFHLAEGDAPLATNETPNAATLKIHILFMTIDPEQLERFKTDEFELRAHYDDAMDCLIAPDEDRIVKTYYTSEIIPEELATWLSVTEKIT